MAELAGVMRDCALVQEQEWQARVTALRRECHTAEGSGKGHELQLQPLREALVSAVGARVSQAQSAGNAKIGVLLSGGVDSTLVALLAKQALQDKKGKGDRVGKGGKGDKGDKGGKESKEDTGEIVGYAAGLDTGEGAAADLQWAERAARFLGIELRQRRFDLEGADAIIRKTARILQEADAQVNAVSVGVGAVMLAAGELARGDGVAMLFSGLGAEETFAGYQRHEQAQEINEECWRGLGGMWQRDFTRDCAIASALGLRLLTPFLDERVIRAAMALPAELKIREGRKKWALRKAAEGMGLPEEFAWRKKKAAQYGSSIDRALRKLTRKHGLRYRRDYLAQIVRTL